MDDTARPEASAWRAVGLSRGGLVRFVRTAQALVGVPGEVEVLLAGDATLKRLNRQYRGKHKATDVLSFPGAPEMAAVHAGDLAISLETAARQAQEHGHTLRDEVRVLLLHGLLHLHGMDHEADTGEMAAREQALRRRLRLPHGLIARAERGEQVQSGSNTAGKMKAKTAEGRKANGAVGAKAEAEGRAEPTGRKRAVAAGVAR